MSDKLYFDLEEKIISDKEEYNIMIKKKISSERKHNPKCEPSKKIEFQNTWSKIDIAENEIDHIIVEDFNTSI